MENAVLQIRIDKELKDKASDLYNSIGIDISTAIRLFLSKSLLSNGLPFNMINASKKEMKVIKKREDLNVYMIAGESLYDEVSVDEYLKESRNDKR